MAWTIPDKGEGLSDLQSILFQEYLDVLVAGLGQADFVMSGCAVTAQGSPDMTVAVAAGSVVAAGVVRAVAGANGTITTADATNPRFDLVVINAAGAIAVRAGAPAAAPKPPARTAGDVVLAVVYVPAADTTIASNQITDLRAVAIRTALLGADNAMVLPDVGAPAIAAAATDTVKLFARKVAGRQTLKYIGPSGIDQFIQDRISCNQSAFYLPNNGTTVGLNLGLGWTSAGTVSHPTPSSTAPAIYSQQRRSRWANVVTTTNQTLGLHTVTAMKTFWRGNAAGLGGFNFHARFAIGLWPAATVRLFVGLSDQNTSPVASDTLAGNCCGLWHDTTEAASVLNFVTRNGTTATKAAITLAANLAAGQCFDFFMWSAPNGSEIYYRLDEMNTGTTLVDTSTTTTIPLSTAFMGPTLQMSNGTANITVTTTAMEVMACSVQADN